MRHLFFAKSRAHKTARNSGLIRAIEQLEPRVLLSSMSPVQDSFPQTLGSYPSNFAAVGKELFFNAVPAGSAGPGFWQSDGHPNGTVPATEMPVQGMLDPVSFKGYTYFTSGLAVYRTDGSGPGTSVVSDGERIFGAAGNHLFFQEFGRLAVTDGTAAGTVLLTSVAGVPNFVDYAFSTDGKMYFTDLIDVHTAAGPVESKDLWVSDGTVAGTQMIMSGLDSGTIAIDAVAPGDVYFLDGGATAAHGLWKTDGTASGTSLVSPVYANQVNQIINVGREIYFTGSDPTHGNQLWKSDGTPGGTVMVSDIDSSLDPQSRAISLINLNGSILFMDFDNNLPQQGLWRSDGTTQGTTQIRSVVGGDVTVFGNDIYYGVNNGIHETELWKSDGTASGTQLVKIFNPSDAAVPNDLTVANGRLFFSADDGVHGVEPWVTDGTAGGTYLLKDINTEGFAGDSIPFDVISANNRVFFLASDPDGTGIFTSDAAHGTTLVTHIVTDGNLTNVNGSVFFTSQQGSKLYVTDGTAAGTVELLDLAARHFTLMFPLIATENRLFFVTQFGGSGFQIWVSNGTPAGTTVIKQWTQVYDTPVFAEALNQTLLFQVPTNNGTVMQLWRTDGTVEGTYQLTSLPSVPSGNPPVWGVSGNTLYFLDPVQGHGILWQTDGTTAGTHLFQENLAYQPVQTYLPPLIIVNGHVLFYARNPSGYGLYVVDDSVGGASLLYQLSSYPYQGAVLGNHLYFVDGSQVQETDGTVAGTRLLKDFTSPSQPSNVEIESLTSVGGALYITVQTQTDLASYEAMWQSDGTGAGTVAISDLPGDTFYYLGPPVLAVNRLYFFVDDDLHGIQLWTTK